jgi:hypothetical protein
VPLIRIASLTVCAVLGGVSAHAQRTACPPAGQESMSVEGNVPIVTLQFKRQNGTIRAARFVFDSGGGAVLFDSVLASDLVLKPSGAEIEEAGNDMRPSILRRPASALLRSVSQRAEPSFMLGPEVSTPVSASKGFCQAKR